jgi:hypothetical protein
MSRTRKGKKPVGYEFWSRRPGKMGSGKVGKQITKRRERALNRIIESNAKYEQSAEIENLLIRREIYESQDD